LRPPPPARQPISPPRNASRRSDKDKGENIKEAFHRDLEQTKNDFSKKRGEDLDQDVDDTVKQATGADPIPPRGTPNPDYDSDD
jgi:hypothetical protein